MNTWLLSEARRTALNVDRQSYNPKKKTEKTKTKAKTTTPEEEISELGSPRESLLEKGVEETSLQDATKIPKFFYPDDVVYYNYNGKQGLKGKIINPIDDYTYLVQPINAKEPPLTINEEEILYKDQYERKGGKTKRNKKQVQRKTKRNKTRSSKKHIKKGKAKKQSK